MLWVALQALPEPASAELVDGCTALGWWALQFTPKVARVDDALLLELSASERLWGGRSALLRHIHAADKPVAGVRFARGATSLIALAQLQLLQAQALPNRARSRTAPDDLPLATLAAARPHLATLQRLGCTRWGQLRALPRGGVARRFGADLLDALDRAYGQAPDSYPWLLLPEQFDATLELGSQVEAAPALLFAARRLFNQLQLWLQARHAGVLALLLGWTMDERRNTASHGELVLRTAEPSADMAHLQRLLAEQLARITLPAPVLYLHLRSLETEKLHGESTSLLPLEQLCGDSLLQMQERLCARLGAGQVLQVQQCAEHRPERMQLWQTLAEETRQGKFAQSDQRVLYPSWLLARPLRLAVRDQCPQYPGPLTLLAGPQRLEAAWGEGADCALRDYFLARSEQFGLLWIYRERLSTELAGSESSWYLHGLFA
ncbi:MAG: DNA polymerase Y family protein [Comamonadaceae bacterium]|nr:MAG: DNA polymerase Y family protein [Comamonadaceae bacterium]